MSDEHAHDDGAHEIDKMPSGRLFNIVVILGGLTLALCFGVIQLFNQQVRNIETERISGGYATQQEYVAEMAEVADGYGKYEIVKPGGEGKPDVVTTRYFVPVDKATQQVIDDPALLKGSTPKRDWAGTGTGKKVQEWGGLPGATPQKPGPKRGDAKKADDAAKVKGPRDHRFAFTVSGEDLVLLGEVPTEDVSKAIEAAAKKTHFGDKVRNKLKVTNAPGKPEFKPAYERALAAMDLMSTGTTKFTAGKLSVEGFVADADKAKLEELTKAEGMPMGKVEINSSEAADACDKKFAKALRKSIAFDDADGKPGAVISAKSAKTIDKLVALVSECPGRVMIEGHTGTEGEAAANKQLSLQRANAVSTAMQEKGVEKARLRAKGYGGERPVATGDDAAAQKKNQRIEVRIAR